MFVNFVAMTIYLLTIPMDNLYHWMKSLVFVTSLSNGLLRQCMENDNHSYRMSPTFDRNDSRWYVAKKSRENNYFFLSVKVNEIKKIK